MAKRGFGDGDNLDQLTHADVNPHLMALSQKEGIKVVAKATPLSSIWADVRQPRRAIPASIRLHWNGSPDEVPQLLNAWGTVVRQWINIDERQIIRGNGEGIDLDGMPSIVESYVSLLRLASDIKHVGLTNPITVVKQGQRHLIESGERRYLAHHLLMMWDDASKWDKVPAIVSDGKDFVWRQASENTARRSLNAIGMSRQLALLIMDAREGVDGVSYNAYEELVLPGGCDRRFYAQVANGNIHRIPKGMGERIQSAMGLSDKQLSRYRNLLKLTDDDAVNDALWVRADVEDWAERVLRDVATSPMGEVRKVISRDDWSLDDLRDLIVDAKEEKQATSALSDAETLTRQRVEREHMERIEDQRREMVEKYSGADRHRDWKRDHEERSEKYDDDLHHEDDGDEYLDNGYYMPKWERGTRVILDEACADWRNVNGVYRPNNAYVLPAGTTAKIKQLFNQRTKRGQHSLARIAVGAYEHIVPVQVLALDAEANQTTTTMTAEEHIATLTGDEVAQGMTSDNGHSTVSGMPGNTMIFLNEKYGDRDLITALFGLLKLVDSDAAEAVRALHNVTLSTVAHWHDQGAMTEEFDLLFEAIKAGTAKMLDEHIAIMMARVEELVRGA